MNDGDTPLHSASRNGHLETVMSLIRAKADVRIMNNNGESPLDVARTDEIRQYIHEHHPWISLMDFIQGYPPWISSMDIIDIIFGYYP